MDVLRGSTSNLLERLKKNKHENIKSFHWNKVPLIISCIIFATHRLSWAHRPSLGSPLVGPYDSLSPAAHKLGRGQCQGRGTCHRWQSPTAAHQKLVATRQLLCSSYKNQQEEHSTTKRPERTVMGQLWTTIWLKLELPLYSNRERSAIHFHFDRVKWLLPQTSDLMENLL